MKLAHLAVVFGTTALIPVVAMAQQQTPNPRPDINPQGQAGATPQSAPQGSGLAVSQLRGQTIYNENGQTLGRVDRIVQGQDKQDYAVVAASNGQALVPINRFAYRGNRFVISGANDQFRFPVYNPQVAAQYKELAPDYRIVVAGFVAPVVAANQAKDGTDVVVSQPAPNVVVDQASPRVVVRQPEPQVTVNQPRPEIIVRQPQPTVQVDIPKPEIIVRMPQPNVNVAMAKPDVSVLMEKPEVAFVHPQQPQVEVQPAKPQVLIQREANAAPNVNVQRAGQPVVHYESAKPRVIVNQPEGQPNVEFQATGQPNVNVQQAPPQQQANAAPAPAPTPAPAPAQANPAGPGHTGAIGETRPIRISDLDGKDIYSVRGQKIGDVQRVVRRIGDNKGFVVLAHGGFLGLGEKEVPIPLNRVFMMGNRLVAAGLTQQEVNAIPDWDYNNRTYREFRNDETVNIGVRG